MFDVILAIFVEGNTRIVHHYENKVFPADNGELAMKSPCMSNLFLLTF
jgi:hypothetical protein